MERSVSWVVKDHQMYTDPDDLLKLKPEHLTSGKWMWPQRWNQGCFDAVQICDDRQINFVQVTRASVHGMKLRFIVTFLNNLAKVLTIDSFRISIIQPEDSSVGFKVGNVVGTLTSLWKPKLAKSGDNEVFCYRLKRNL